MRGRSCLALAASSAVPWKLLLCLCVALVGCGPTAVATETTSGLDTTTAVETTSTATDGAEPTTGAAQPDLPGADPATACAAMCDAQAACRGEPGVPDCVTRCVQNLGHGAGDRDERACTAADAALTACGAGLDCAVLLGEHWELACEEALRATLTACNLCYQYFGWLDEVTCSYDSLCPDGMKRIECSTTACVCTFEGAITKTCPSNGCALEGIPDDGIQCCGL